MIFSMSKTNIVQINKELKKWLISSQKVKTTSAIIHAKIRAHVAVYESKATQAELSKLQSDMGKIIRKKNIFIFNKNFRGCPEDNLEKQQPKHRIMLGRAR